MRRLFTVGGDPGNTLGALYQQRLQRHKESEMADIKDECLEPSAEDVEESAEEDESYRKNFRSECLDFAWSVAKTIVLTAAATMTSALVTLAIKKTIGR